QVLAEALQDRPEQRVQADAWRFFAAIYWKQGRLEDAIHDYRQAADLDRGTGRLSSALANELAISQLYLNQGSHFAEARQALERAEQLTQEIPAERVGIAYSKGILAYETGDFGTALRQFRLV